jgi:hypothetical protein
MRSVDAVIIPRKMVDQETAIKHGMIDQVLEIRKSRIVQILCPCLPFGGFLLHAIRESNTTEPFPHGIFE